MEFGVWSILIVYFIINGGNSLVLEVFIPVVIFILINILPLSYSLKMATIRRFEDLKIWIKARNLNQSIFPYTKREPISLDLRFRDQIRGSLGSIMDNIAEGFERGSRNEFINSLSIARGEAGELKSQLYRGFDNGYFSAELFELFLVRQMKSKE